MNVRRLEATGVLVFIKVVAFSADVGNDGKVFVVVSVVVGARQDVIGAL